MTVAVLVNILKRTSSLITIDRKIGSSKMKNFFAAFCCMMLVLFTNTTNASHIYGAELIYTHISGNTYQVSMNIYGDCGGGSFPGLPSAPQVRVLNGNSLYATLTLIPQSPTSGVEVTPVCPSQINNTKCSNVNNTLPGVKRFTYVRNVTLNTTSANWRFRFEGNMGTGNPQAGRSNSITNIPIPSGVGSLMTLEATLNNTSGPNSSPTYTTIPTPFFCINKAAGYNPGTVDPNGDSLYYNLVPALLPTSTVTYLTGYSATSPLAYTTGTFSFSNTSGQLNFTPNIVQQSVVVNRVDEYKNGVKVGSSMREMTFVVINNCSNNAPGGIISSSTAGSVSTNGLEIDVCKSAGNFTFNINATDLDNDKINVTANGLPAGATFTVTNNGTTSPVGLFSWNVTNVATGTYTFFITFIDEGCPLSSKQTVAYTIKVLPNAEVGITIDSLATCVKKAVYTMTPSVSPSPWRLQVFQGATQIRNFTNVTGPQTDSLSPGTYIVRVTNNDTCFKDTTLVIDPPPTVNIGLEVTPITCHNDTNGKVVVKASGGKPSFVYSVNTGAYTTDSTFDNLPAGFYTFKIKDQNECVKDTLISIVNPPAIGADINYLQPPCNFFSSGVITVQGTNGTTPYLYAFNGGTYSSVDSFFGLPSGVYSISIKDSNDCKLDTAAVLQDSIKVKANVLLTHILCNGDSTGAITLNAYDATAPYKYQITGGPLSTANTFNGLPATTHNFHIEDSNKCYLDTAITLNQPTAITHSSNVTNVLCNGDTTGGISIVPNGGVIPYTYAIGAGAYGPSNSFSPLTSGTYTLHIKDDNGCVKDTTITITEPTELKMDSLLATEPSCYSGNNGQVVIKGSGGVTSYTYAIGTGTFGASNTFGTLAAGTYTFRIRDNNNCEVDSTYQLTQPTRIVPSASVDISTCIPLNDGQITVGATGGTPGYTFAIGTGAYSTNPVFSSLASGTYTVHVQDKNNCVQDSILVVLDSLDVTGNMNITDAKCFDSSSGSIVIVPAGGVNPYTFAINAGAYGASNTFGNLKAGTYTIHIKDNIGCELDTNISVTEPTAVATTAVVTEPSCNSYNDGAVQLLATGGTPGYLHNVNNGTFSPPNTFPNLTAGTYLFSVMDNNGCIKDTSIILNEPTALNYTFNVTNVNCNGDSTGTVLVNGSGGTPGYLYAYGTNAFQTNPLISNIPAGQHIIKMRDTMGCIKDSTIFITEPAKLFITNPFIENPTCEGFPDGAVTVYGNGGVKPYSFSVNNGGLGSSNVFNSLTEGTHRFTVKDANGCTYDTSITLTGYPHILYDGAQIEDVSCFGFADGAIQLYASGGVQPLLYKIEGGLPVDSTYFDELKAGDYRFTIIDSAGCEKDSVFSVGTPDIIKLSTKITPNDCEGYDNGGSIEAFVEGGTGPFEYRWQTEPEQYGFRLSGVENGTYKVLVTDFNNCTDSIEATVVYDNCCKIFVPDAFTPNGDGVNDVIHVKLKGDFKLKTFSIYNRFGELVFETSNISDGWDGVYNGIRQNLSTFNYFVTGVCGNASSEEVMFKGTIQLIR